MTGGAEYGRALFLLAKEISLTDKIKEDLTVCLRAFDEHPEYKKMLDTPAISKEEKLALAGEALAPLPECVVNLVQILSERHSVSLLGDVYDAYVALYNEEHGIEEVEAVSAIAMTVAQLDALKQKLEAITGKTVIIKNTVDGSILGGVKLRYEGKQIDASVRTRLDGFAAGLRNIVI